MFRSQPGRGEDFAGPLPLYPCLRPAAWPRPPVYPGPQGPREGLGRALLRPVPYALQPHQAGREGPGACPATPRLCPGIAEGAGKMSGLSAGPLRPKAPTRVSAGANRGGLGGPAPCPGAAPCGPGAARRGWTAAAGRGRAGVPERGHRRCLSPASPTRSEPRRGGRRLASPPGGEPNAAKRVPAIAGERAGPAEPRPGRRRALGGRSRRGPIPAGRARRDRLGSAPQWRGARARATEARAGRRGGSQDGGAGGAGAGSPRARLGRGPPGPPLPYPGRAPRRRGSPPRPLRQRGGRQDAALAGSLQALP